MVSMLTICLCGAEEVVSGIEATPYVEAIEVKVSPDRARTRTIRSYRTIPGNTTLFTSYLVVVPWNWEEREIKAFTKLNFEVGEGTLSEVAREWWEEIPRAKYPCVPLGRKIMAKHMVVNVISERGLITTISEQQTDREFNVVYLFAEEGEGSRFVSLFSERGEDSAILCGQALSAGQIDEKQGMERRWKIAPGSSIAIQTFRTQ